MRPWYRYSAKTDDYPQRTFITPFSRLWGFGASATLALIAVNCAIWLLMVITNATGWLPLDKWWYPLFAMTPKLVFQGRVHQVLTSVFLHDGSDLLHLLVNMYLLWVFGPRVERAFSSKMFLGFYLATGVVGSLVSLVARTIGGPTDIPSLGASAAVFGILVAYAFLFANDVLLLFFVIPIRAWKAVVGFIVLESMFVMFGMMQTVDHWAHLGGAAAAAVWMLVLIRVKGHKTAHGWHKGTPYPGRPGFRRDSGPPPPGPRGGFRIVIGRPKATRTDHPEGTDDEPPPEWFDIDV